MSEEFVKEGRAWHKVHCFKFLLNKSQCVRRARTANLGSEITTGCARVERKIKFRHRNDARN